MLEAPVNLTGASNMGALPVVYNHFMESHHFFDGDN